MIAFAILVLIGCSIFNIFLAIQIVREVRELLAERRLRRDIAERERQLQDDYRCSVCHNGGASVWVNDALYHLDCVGVKQ